MYVSDFQVFLSFVLFHVHFEGNFRLIEVSELEKFYKQYEKPLQLRDVIESSAEMYVTSHR